MFNTLKVPLLVGGSLFFVWWFFLADIQTNSTEVHYTRTEFREDAGTIYYDMGRLALARRDYQSAIKSLSDAVAIYPEMLNGPDTLGQALETTGQLDKAFTTYTRAMQENAHFLDYRLDPAIISAEPYKNTDVLLIPGIRPWQGESLQGKKLYVYSEKGLGETLMFCRFLKHTSAQAQQIFFRPQAELADYMRNALFNKVTIVDTTTDLTSLTCTYYTSLLSLPYYLGITYQRLSQERYAYLPVVTKQEQSSDITFNKNTFNIGIVWHKIESLPSSSSAQKITLSQFYTLAKLANVQLYSFQKNAAAEEFTTAAQATISIINLEPQLKDFSAIASALQHLDLVIGVESALVHLSGALGLPTLMITPHTADWRWFTIGEATQTSDNNSARVSASVWYQNFLKIQQPNSEAWEPVFAEIYKRVKEKAAAKSITKKNLPT